jgi:hypothetical protein
VVLGARPPWPAKRQDGKYLVWGRTQAGRILQVIYFYPDDLEVDVESLTLADLISWSDGSEMVAYVIHARGLAEQEKKQFRKRSRKR